MEDKSKFLKDTEFEKKLEHCRAQAKARGIKPREFIELQRKKHRLDRERIQKLRFGCAD